MKFKCKICGKWMSTENVAVIPETRKNKRGRIAWARDGVCFECATKRNLPKVEQTVYDSLKTGLEQAVNGEYRTEAVTKEETE